MYKNQNRPLERKDFDLMFDFFEINGFTPHQAFDLCITFIMCVLDFNGLPIENVLELSKKSRKRIRDNWEGER